MADVLFSLIIRSYHDRGPVEDKIYLAIYFVWAFSQIVSGGWLSVYYNMAELWIYDVGRPSSNFHKQRMFIDMLTEPGKTSFALQSIDPDRLNVTIYMIRRRKTITDTGLQILVTVTTNNHLTTRIYAITIICSLIFKILCFKPISYSRLVYLTLAASYYQLFLFLSSLINFFLYFQIL